MKSILIDLWVSDGDNVEYELSVSEKVYEKLADASEGDELTDYISDAEYQVLWKRAESEIKRSFKENYEDEWEEEFEACDWGFSFLHAL